MLRWNYVFKAIPFCNYYLTKLTKISKTKYICFLTL